MDAIQLKNGREKSLLRRHPWIFSGAIAKVIGDPGIGESVWVIDANGRKYGTAAYSPQSSIRARMWSFDPEEAVDPSFIVNKIRIAINYRKETVENNPHTNSYRLVHAESDGLPGLVVDQYNDVLVVQFLSAGPEFWRSTIIEALVSLTKIERVYERSDVEVRKLEGLEKKVGPLNGKFDEKHVDILENELKFKVDIQNGQKTGFFIDQRNNREAILPYVKGKNILNCFSYTGAFGVYALKNGAAHITSIESSEDANQLALQNMHLNGEPPEQATIINGDVFQELRLLRDKAQSFDMVILDPPKFAPTAAQVRSASRGYKDINLLAFKLLNPNGILVTFSCSGGITRNLFQKIVADAALDAGVEAQIISYLSQGEDHPIALNFPEGEYLKGLICRLQ